MNLELKNLQSSGRGTRENPIQVPGLDDPKRLKDLLGTTAKMTFHLIDPFMMVAMYLVHQCN